MANVGCPGYHRWSVMTQCTSLCPEVDLIHRSGLVGSKSTDRVAEVPTSLTMGHFGFQGFKT